MDISQAIERIADLLRDASCAVAFTGAGVSTESGIPDYRSPGGQWTNRTPPQLQEFLAGEAGRAAYWRYYQEFYPVIARAQPGPAHIALARLHAAGFIKGVITQNIDGLHKKAGLPDEAVWELHGNAHASTCLACAGYSLPTAEALARFEAKGASPMCPRCGGPLKPGTISFGQNLDQAVLQGAVDASERAGVMLCAGSSLVVHPAAGLPLLTLRRGGSLALVNLGPTPLDGRAAVLLRSPAGAALSALADALGA